MGIAAIFNVSNALSSSGQVAHLRNHRPLIVGFVLCFQLLVKKCRPLYTFKY